MYYLQIFAFILFLLRSATASSSGSSFNPRQVPASLVYQFDNGSWVENIAVRWNGNLLVTLTDRAEVYEVDPSRPIPPRLVKRFPGYSSALGITEVEPDLFAIIVGNYSFTTLGGIVGSFALWRADFSRRPATTISKITDLPEGILLNGITTLNQKDGTVLIGDSTAGVVFRLNTYTGEYAAVLKHESMVPPPDALPAIGINGLRKLRNYLYYVNTWKELYMRVPIDPVSGEAIGPYETLATGILADDFTIGEDGVAYLAGNAANIVTRVNPDGSSEVIAGNLNSTEVAGATSIAFGRRRSEDFLYVTTSGAQGYPVNGSYSEGGKVVALRI